MGGRFKRHGVGEQLYGEQIPVEEMRIWVEETVGRLRALKPRRVLEVGCGTGLLLSRLAGGCERYIGIDFSREVLKQLGGYVATRADLKHVELREGMAEMIWDFWAMTAWI